MDASTAPPAPTPEAKECPVQHAIKNYGADLSLAQQKALLGMQTERVTPGPPAFSLASLLDVTSILTGGIHKAMLTFSIKYGPVCRFANPANLNAAAGWLFVNGPEDVQYLCSTNVRNYQRRYLPDIYKWVTHEKGILGSQDDYNARHRRLCQPPFRSKSVLNRFSGVISKRALELVDIWREFGEHETDVSLQTQRLTLDVVGLTAFSHDFGETAQTRRELAGEQAQKEDQLLWAVNTFGSILAQVFITPLPMLRFMERLGDPTLKTLIHAVNTMRGSMLGVIHRRREELARGVDTPQDLLGVLLEAEDEEGARMTDEELWEDVHDIMGAGHETTATTTAAVLYCVSAHPEVARRVRDELSAVLGDARAPTHEQLEELPYLRAVVKEVLRLYPAIPIFPREAMDADVLPSGDRVLAGDVVFMSSYALGRSPALWEDATTFNPDRFYDEEQAARHHRFQYLPFGGGPRMCLGAGFASMSVQMMAAVLLKNFNFVPIHPTAQEIPVDYDITMNFNPTNGLKMRVVPQ